ncbi:MAG TPA: hypothetical protein VGA08_02680 [Candidatus Saccharimonadales bacterium]
MSLKSPTDNEQSNAEESSENFQYQILTGIRRAGEDVSDEQLRAEYLRRTERLIDTLADSHPDYVVFLDKSARPVSWMMDQMWDTVRNDTPRPDIKFVNIDREQWRDEVGSNLSHINADRIDFHRINELRALFLQRPVQDNGAGEVGSDVMTKPSIFDEKNVVIIDEVKTSGDTLDIAKAIFRRAFPRANISGKYWMIPKHITIAGGGTANAELPVWYREDSIIGRGVGNRDTINSARSNSKAQRVGRWFLSTRFESPDPRSRQLREEIEHLTSTFMSGSSPKKN